MPYFYAFILGTHPEISYAELKALLPEAEIRVRKNVALVETNEELEGKFLSRLGGSIKLIELVWKNDVKPESLVTLLPVGKEQKLLFGVSVYPENPEGRKKAENLGSILKRALKEKNISARFVSSRENALSSVVVAKNHLLERGAEIVLVEDTDGFWVGRTLAIQDFARYSKRDYGRPARDDASGMLPPKLAQIMINLTGKDTNRTLLDPFCGSGTILQEAALMGYTRITGSDKSTKAVQDSKRNIAWLQKNFPETQKANVSLSVKDVVLPPTSKNSEQNVIVFEGYLGPTNPHLSQIKKIKSDIESLYEKTFVACATILPKNGLLCAALPFWQFHDKIVQLNWRATLPENFTIIPLDEGNNQTSLFYKRPAQTVGREILLVKKI